MMFKEFVFSHVGAFILAVCSACSRPPQAQPDVVNSTIQKMQNNRNVSDGNANLSDAPTSNGDSAASPKQPSIYALSNDEVCAIGLKRIGQPLLDVPAFDPVPIDCEECNTVDISPDPEDICFVANDNIRRAERESRKHRGSDVAGSQTQFSDRIDSHLHLDKQERALLSKNGFVVLDRLAFASYAGAYHSIFQQQLPVFITVDSVLHAIFQSNSVVLFEIERKTLMPKLVALISRMRRTLAKNKNRFGIETANDLDLYLTVADRLLGAGEKNALPLFPGNTEWVDEIVRQVKDASDLTEVRLFGRNRMVDFTQFEPRGHYLDDDYSDETPASLADYFRAMMWFSRIELNLVSRSCRSSQPGTAVNPDETPREARVAMALSDLTRSAKVGHILDDFEKVYAVFAGRREDVSPSELIKIMNRAGIAFSDRDASEKLKTAIGDGFRRTVSIHFMPEGVDELPVIATLLGPRIVPDIAPLAGLVHDRLPERMALSAADVGYVLGHDRAMRYIAPHPGLEEALGRSRVTLAKGLEKRADLFGLWLKAVRDLAPSDSGLGHRPSFMKTDAFKDLRLGSALVAYGQIRHNYVLLAGQGYDNYGCEIPDGYVEPALATYNGLIRYARAARKAVPSVASYFERVAQVLSMLRDIAQTERDGMPLSEPQRRWLGMVAEHIPQGGYFTDTNAPPQYTGWYYDLFVDREHGAHESPAFIADYFTLTNIGQIAYLGAETPRLGVFLVDVGGSPRLMVGPVAKGYELRTAIDVRLNDESAKSAEGKRAPWMAEYLAPAPARPRLQVKAVVCPAQKEHRVVVQSPESRGAISVTLINHHGDAVVETVTEALSPKGDAPRTWEGVFAFRPAQDVEGLHLSIDSNGSSGDRYDFTSLGLKNQSEFELGPRRRSANAPRRAAYGNFSLSP